ncbi:MAG: hypothetical protein QM817_40900 [Archangium sp.]
MQVDAFVDDGQVPLGRLDVGAAEFDMSPSRPTPRVMVRWALPDALTRAEATTAEKMELRYTAIPDRWCVYRLWPQTTGERLSVKAWLIDSRTAHGTSIQTWNAMPPMPAGDRVRLTAFGLAEKDLSAGTLKLRDRSTADPYFAVCFDRALGRLNFVDDSWVNPPELGEATCVSYVVAGWFGDELDDPLHGLVEPCALRDKLRDLELAITNAALRRGRPRSVLAGGAQGVARVAWRPNRCRRAPFR